MEQHLLSRPVVKSTMTPPTSIDQIRIIIRRLPKDLKGTLHEEGKITVPLDAKHRASNWREILEHLQTLGASKEQIDSFSDDIEQRIISRLKRQGRIIEAWKKESKAEAQPTSPTRRSKSHEPLVVHEGTQADEREGLIDGYAGQFEDEARMDRIGGPSDLGSLSVKELFQLAKGIRGCLNLQEDLGTRRSRSEIVKAFAKAWASGVCQFCRNMAQYTDRDGTSRLHVHHIVYLENAGEDCIENVVAICPNCHDIIHIRQDKTEEALLKARVEAQLSKLK